MPRRKRGEQLHPETRCAGNRYDGQDKVLAAVTVTARAFLSVTVQPSGDILIMVS